MTRSTRAPQHHHAEHLTRRPGTAFGTLALATVLATSACGAASTGADNANSTGAGGSVVLLLPGQRGDGGFFDQSVQGVEAGAKAAGWNSQVIEAGSEPTKWQPALTDVASGNADVIITGSYSMKEVVEQTAAQYPDKKFVLYDVAADLTACGCDNIYSITYRYDQTGFLAGALAGLVETSASGIPRLNPQHVVGVVGGQELPVIQDYVAGFTQGVALTAPDTKVLSAYAGSFDDPVKGKAIASDMIGQGADVLFTAAGGTDQGVIEAAGDEDVWAIGNSRQQAESAQGDSPVLTSSDTSVSTSLQDAVRLAAAGKLPTGQSEEFGVADGTNSIIDSPQYQQVVPQELRDKVKEITQQLAAGDIEIKAPR